MKTIQRIKNNIDVVLIFVFCIVVFYLIFQHIDTDIRVHLEHIRNINKNETTYPPNFGFYFVINALSGFSNVKHLQVFNVVLLLSLATASKYAISKQILLQLNRKTFTSPKHNLLILIALALFFCFSIPDPASLLILGQYYLGRFAPIVWHNSTTILLFPFAILLFWEQMKKLGSPEKASTKQLLLLNLLVVLNAIIKPSFLFVYLPVTFLFLIFKYKKINKEFLLNISPLITGGVIILFQTFFIYQLEVGAMQQEDSSVSIGSPFKVMSTWIPIWFIPFSFAMSYALPIYTAIIYKKIAKYKPFLYAVALAFFGVLIGAFIYETGPRMNHGNFMWQNIICAYLVFLTTISFLTPKLINRKLWGVKDKIMVGLLTLHALSGVFYLIHIAISNSYY